MIECVRGQLLQQGRPIAKVEGSWLESCVWDGVTYWELSKVDPIVLIRTDKPLPSDCRFRTDLIELAHQNLDRA